MLTQKQIIVFLSLLLLAGVSAVSVVYAKHQHRVTFMKMDKLQKERDKLQVVWRQLLLEQSTLSAHHRVESKAKQALNMRHPKPKEVRRLML